jgi:hypothetical protein
LSAQQAQPQLTNRRLRPGGSLAPRVRRVTGRRPSGRAGPRTGAPRSAAGPQDHMTAPFGSPPATLWIVVDGSSGERRTQTMPSQRCRRQPPTTLRAVARSKSTSQLADNSPLKERGGATAIKAHPTGLQSECLARGSILESHITANDATVRRENARACSRLRRSVALDRDPTSGSDLRIIVPDRKMLHTAIVPDHNRMGLPAKSHLEIFARAVFE